MKRYSITINGKNYEVAVEELGGTPAISAAARSPAPAIAAVPAAVPAAPTTAAPTTVPTACLDVAGATTIKSPMPGTVLSFAVTRGQAVRCGDVVLILEAMKMENEIVASVDGTVTALRVAPGASVNTGEPLIDIA